MTKLQYNGFNYTVVLPKAMVEQTNWNKGDTLTVSFNERGNLEIRKVMKKERL
jgi:antitoxin component of MazEF toxin-antitoxin module